MNNSKATETIAAGYRTDRPATYFHVKKKAEVIVAFNRPHWISIKIKTDF